MIPAEAAPKCPPSSSSPKCVGTLTVTKVVVNNDGGTASASDFTLLVDGNPVASGVPVSVAPGAHVVSETGGPTGYTASISGDCDAQGNVTLAAGETKSCTITKQRRSAP